MFGDLLVVSAVFRASPTLCFFLGFLSFRTGPALPYMLSSAIGAFDNQVSALLPLPLRASNYLILMLVCPVLLYRQVAFRFCLGVALAVNMPPLRAIGELHVRLFFLVSLDCKVVSTDPYSFLEESVSCILSPDCEYHR
jgi:hypothetical protein